MLTTSPGKEADARRLGASRVVSSRDADQMAAVANQVDFILVTVAVSIDLAPSVQALKRDGTLVMVGAPSEPHKGPPAFDMIFGRRSIAGSLIGGPPETQEMLDFCGEHGLTADLEIIPISAIDEAYARRLASDVKYRFVIDMQSLKNEVQAAG